MVGNGDRAPTFTLPGYYDGAGEAFDLSEAVADNDAVLLLCYPFDCSPVCSGEPCALRDAEWFELLENVETWAVSSDSVSPGVRRQVRHLVPTPE